MQDDAGGDAGAAVRDDVAVGNVRQWLVPRRVARPWDTAGAAIDGVLLAAPPRGHAGVDDDELLAAPRELVRVDRVVGARPRPERSRLERLVARDERAVPRIEVDHAAVVVAEMAK